jgi:outer membrane protein TolC
LQTPILCLEGIDLQVLRVTHDAILSAPGRACSRFKVHPSRYADALSEYALPNTSTVQNDFIVGPTVNYEFDFFGRVRREVEGARASAEQAAADYDNTRLLLIAQLASDYFTLRELDAEVRADASVHRVQRAFDIASDRYKGGVDTYLDVITAEQTLLADQRHAAQIHGQQFLTTVYLIKALGGGWAGVPRTASRSD